MVIDSHAHLTETVTVMRMGGKIDVEGCMSHQKLIGCDVVIQSAEAGEKSALEAIGLYEQTEGRVYSLFMYNPTKIQQSLEAMDKYCGHPAFVGVKIHPSDHSVFAEDEGYIPVWEWAKKHAMPIMSHTWAATSNPKQAYATPDRFEGFIKAYPEVDFVFGHSGGRVNGIKKAVEIGTRYKNTYYDLAGDVYNRGVIEYICKNIGADRLMIGSDVFWFDLTVPMGMVLGADISDKEKELIMGGNAARLFRIKER